MAEIQKREVVQRIVGGLRIEGGTENVPTVTEDKVRVVYVANEVGEIKVIQDDVANEDDKTITVPTGKKWKIISILIDYTATATVGNRRMGLFFKTANGDNFWESKASSNITASLQRTLLATPNATPATSDNILHISMPTDAWLDEGMQINIAPNSSIDVLDDMLFRVHVLEFSREG